MSYIELSKDYIGKTDGQILISKWPFQEGHLFHPLAIDQKILQSFLPDEIDIENILALTRIKQKEIVKRIDIRKLPADRPPGYIGQIALYEVLRELNYDFSYIVEKTELEWDNSGFVLLSILLRLHIIYQELGMTDTNLCDGFLESRDDLVDQNVFDELWIDRAHRARWSALVSLDYFRRPLVRKLVTQLNFLSNKRRLTINRLQQHCNFNKMEAVRMMVFLKASAFSEHYRLVPRNFGLTRSYSLEFTSPKPQASTFARCKDVHNDSTVYVSSILDFPDTIDTPHLDSMVFHSNMSLYDEKANKWVLPHHVSNAKSRKDLLMIGFNSDSFYKSKERRRVSKREVFMSALLVHQERNHIESLGNDLEGFISRIAGLDRDIVSRGVRTMKRRNLVFPIFNVPMGPYKPFFILSQESSDSLIPYIDSIAKSTPRGTFYLSSDANAVYSYVEIPVYLEKEFIQIEKNLQDIFGLDRQLLSINQVARYGTSSLLSLLPKFPD